MSPTTTPPAATGPATAPTGADQLTPEQRRLLSAQLQDALSRGEPLGLLQGMMKQAQLPTGEAAVLRVQAIAKQREASALFRQADELEHAAALAAQLAEAKRHLDAAEAQAAGLAEAVAPLVVAERAAADRLADAGENLRLAVDAVEAARLDEAPPAVLTDALVRVDAAKRVVDEFRVKAERATADRLAAEATLAQGRDVVKRGREALKAAQAVAERQAGPAPRTGFTLLLDWQWLVSTEADSLTKPDLDVIRGTVLNLARQTGADKVLANEARGQLQKENGERFQHAVNSVAPLPKRADVYVPVDSPARR